MYQRAIFTQGTCDSLCGLYAIVNSVKTILKLNTTESIDCFKYLCEEMININPRILVQGTIFKTQLKLTRLVEEYFISYGLKVTTPFKSKGIKSIEEFQSELTKRINNDNTCAILGLGHPWNHWTVAQYATEKSIKLIDSSNIGKFSGHEWIRFKNLTVTDEAAKLNIHPTQTMILSIKESIK